MFRRLAHDQPSACPYKATETRILGRLSSDLGYPKYRSGSATMDNAFMGYRSLLGLIFFGQIPAPKLYGHKRSYPSGSETYQFWAGAESNVSFEPILPRACERSNVCFKVAVFAFGRPLRARLLHQGPAQSEFRYEPDRQKSCSSFPLPNLSGCFGRSSAVCLPSQVGPCSQTDRWPGQESSIWRRCSRPIPFMPMRR